MRLPKFIFGAACAGVISLGSVSLAANGGTGIGKIGRVGVYENGVFVDTNLTSNPIGCTGPVGRYVLLSTASNYSALQSTLLAAYLAGKSVSFWVNGCNAGGDPSIVAVYMQ